MRIKLKTQKKLPLFLLFLCLSMIVMAAERVNTNYYLGVIGNGYPEGMITNELKYAGAQVVDLQGKMILFGITEKTKLTTFLRNLPFLTDVYADASDITDNELLRKNPLAQKFLSLLAHPSPTPSAPAPGITEEKKKTNEENESNMILIDQLIREKARKFHTPKETQKVNN